ncbi:hypothetical protein LSAT2_028814 [Lamellibrachia satsuma]|nr:hypothetical protein LSAT2_028814 [Lamellibrachia satsuma]
MRQRYLVEHESPPPHPTPPPMELQNSHEQTLNRLRPRDPQRRVGILRLQSRADTVAKGTPISAGRRRQENLRHYRTTIHEAWPLAGRASTPENAGRCDQAGMER